MVGIPSTIYNFNNKVQTSKNPQTFTETIHPIHFGKDKNKNNEPSKPRPAWQVAEEALEKGRQNGSSYEARATDAFRNQGGTVHRGETVDLNANNNVGNTGHKGQTRKTKSVRDNNNDDDDDSQGGGDPHFVGPKGQRYDVMGVPGKWHNIFSTDTNQLNGLFRLPKGVPTAFSNRWGWAGTRITAVTLNAQNGDHVDFNFKKPPVLVQNDKEKPMQAGEDYTLAGNTHAKWDKKHATLVIDTPDVGMQLKAYRYGLPLAHLSEHSVFTAKDPIKSGDIQPQGILGNLNATKRVEQYGAKAHQDGDRGVRAQGGGVLEMFTPDNERVLSPLNSHGDTTAVEQYVTSGPTATDDRFSQFKNPFAPSLR